MDALVRTAINLTKPSAGKLLVDEYKEKIKAEAEELVLNHFPKKILDLDTMVKTEKFSLSSLNDIHTKINAIASLPEPSQNSHDEQQPAKKRKLDGLENDLLTSNKVVNCTPHVAIPCNKFIVELVDIVKPCIRQLVEDANVLKMWIQFLIPRIEDGNNFGVSIQEETLAEIRTVESDGAAFFDQISRYFITRGKIVSKFLKYPHVEDYQRTVRELDEKEYLSLRLVLCELRNHYSSLHDMITKNMEKIKRPRSSNTENMY